MADVRGLHRRQQAGDASVASETLRFDVDGTFPQMAASDTGFSRLLVRLHPSQVTATCLRMG